jgi:hypothetical protein
VAYFTQTTNTAIPSKRTYGDIILEQLMSVDRWGKQFLVPNARQRGYTINQGEVLENTLHNLVRIIASENGTQVTFTGATRYGGQNIVSGGTLNAGQWVELLQNDATGACYITSTLPVGVCAYLVGDGNGNTNAFIGDPANAWIPAINQPITSAVVAPFYPPATTSTDITYMNDSRAQHYAIIITKTDTKQQTTISNGKTFSTWTDHAASKYSYGTIKFTSADRDKSFKIENPSGVIVLCYGISRVESYYYNAGSGACVIN